MAEENKKIFPWGLHPLDNWIKDELDRRTREYDFNPTKNPTNEKPYSGPKTAWTRVFSNGKSSELSEQSMIADVPFKSTSTG